MFQNILFATLRNLARNRAYTAVGILGLSIGLCAALLTGLSVYQQLRYEHFIPGYERIYLAASGFYPGGRPPIYMSGSPGFQAARMQQVYPEIEAITRLANTPTVVKQGQIEANEWINWVDPNMLDVLPLPLISGSLQDALARPDSIVLTEHLARKYFGDQNPIGRTLLLDGKHVETVTAVARDLPRNQTNIEGDAFARGSEASSALARCDRDDIENSKRGALAICGWTLFRLNAKTDIGRLTERIPELIASYPPLPAQFKALAVFMPIDRVNLFEGLHPGARAALAESLAVGALILFAACVVFVNLATARAAQRAKEVGVRKACGADRSALIVQFIGESLLTVLLASLLAMSMTELLLPKLNAFLDTTIDFDYWRQPALLAWIALGALLVSLAAGAYPALVLSSFRPKDVLKGSIALSGSQWSRQLLIVSQCAILIGLIVASAVVYQQRHFATHEALRVNADQVLVVHSPCQTAFVDALRALPGVRQAHCSSESFLTDESFCNCLLKDGTPLAVNFDDDDFGAFALYGIAPLAGSVEPDAADTEADNRRGEVVINQAALKRLGFNSAAAAIGQPLELRNGDGSWVAHTGNGRDAPPQPENTIIAVVPDFAFEAVMQPIRPTVYWPMHHVTSRASEGKTNEPGLIAVKLKSNEIPETLTAIDRLWGEFARPADSSSNDTIRRYFVHDYIENLYRGVLRQAQAFGMFAVIAVVLASLGLLGLASAVASRRTKEVGIRKALGAGTTDILLMLLRQFSLPVLWASLLAWPISAWLLSRWLDSFARHVSLRPIVFVAASALALLISLATVSWHVWQVASTKPVTALRYE